MAWTQMLMLGEGRVGMAASHAIDTRNLVGGYGGSYRKTDGHGGNDHEGVIERVGLLWGMN